MEATYTLHGTQKGEGADLCEGIDCHDMACLRTNRCPDHARAHIPRVISYLTNTLLSMERTKTGSNKVFSYDDNVLINLIFKGIFELILT